ncbi:G-type lectin S-receptor-like serine/threonine-protein kinase [Tanacetum coccineum]
MSSSFDQVLSIDPDTGNLIITSEGKIITNITDIDVGPNPNVTATLEDNGNFRLINEVDKRVLWQSFDYPNVVLMPGMKLGYDLTTGQNWTLTSWMSNENPDSGAFTLSWEAPDEASQRLVIRRRGQPYWTSGNLNNQTFEYMPPIGRGSGLPECWTENDNFSKQNGEFVADVTTSVIDINSFVKSLMLISEEERHRRSDEYFLELTASESFKDVHQLENNGGKGNDLLIFSFASIMDATEEFSAINKLGQGGFGPVYKGRLKDGQEIAIKRLSTTSKQGLVEFKNELILIAKLQHTNLVRVLGCCIHGVEKMLIYEYMPNKSLDSFLFDEKKKAELDWPTRVKIIEGIAQGLLYLHKYSRMRVIHRDLKASNILLDECMNPKISDFGMARIFKQNEAEAMTSRVVGTFGYMSPEYVMGGTFSVKSDIFRFGVLIMEIVTGRRNSSFASLDRTFNLIGHAWELWQQAKILELKDPTVESTCVVQQFSRTIHVALLCVQDSAIERPTTSDIISMLLNDTISLPTPNKPPYAMVRGQSMSTSNGRNSEPKDFSVNNMSITVMDGR